MFNSTASTSTRCSTGNVRQRQRQRQPQHCMPAVEAAMHALLPHACMLCMCCAPCAPGWRSGATVGCCGRIPRSTGRRKRARAAATRLIASAMHVCVNARVSVRVPVHGVGESDRPNQMHSDMKYIFCEYLRPFAARGEHVVARARAHRASGFMVSQACT